MAGKDFVHLHNHSSFSLLDGLTSPTDLVKCASDMGFDSIALTDHGTCAGLVEFQKACEEKKLKPILGMEAYTTIDHAQKDKESRTHHLVLLAKNKVGYRNLMKLSTFGFLEGFYRKPRIDFDVLSEHREGLIVTSACPIGEIPFLLWNDNRKAAEELAGKFKDVFGDDFYLELMIHSYFNDSAQEEKERKLASEMYKMGKKLGIKSICSNDTHYARKDDWKPHDVLLAIQTHNTIKNPDRFSFRSKDFYLKPVEEMAALYRRAPEVLLNTVEIAEKIEKDIIAPSDDLLPRFDLPQGFDDEEDYLKELVSNGMKQYGLIDKPEYRERIKYEMSVITRCNYTKYFLILWDIINFARTQGIRVGVGRGSAVSSLCLYVLGITKLDPIHYNLIFERFLNPDRISPPDVDVDFDYFRRDEIFDYINRKYGADHCCKIGTTNSYKARATVKFCAKALDVGKDWEIYEQQQKKNPEKKLKFTNPNSLNISDAISKKIPLKAENIQDAMRMAEDFRYAMNKYPELNKYAMAIEGTYASAGVHPAGIIVCKDPVVEHVPLRASKGVVCSQFDGSEVEDLGLLKFDLLAIKTLTLIEKTFQLAKSRRPNSEKLQKLDIDLLDPNDKKVFELFNGVRGKNTKGIFQFESGGMVKLLRDIKVDTFEDLIVAVALFRPGPLGSGMNDMYCTYKHDPSKIELLHPKMGEILKDTYGIMVFQENVMQVAVALAGFTGGQSDTLRKAVGKKKKDLMEAQRELFVKGCVDNKVDEQVAKKIFEQIEFFGGYGFNRSHAAAYAFISFQTAWLKTYFPIEFMCYLLTNELSGQEDKLKEYLSEAERMGIRCVKPDINKSGLEFKIDKDKDGNEVLRKPLTILKGVGAKAVENIVENQPYHNIRDFLERVNRRQVNSKVFNALVNSGCMDDSWKTPRELLIAQYDEIKKQITKEEKARAKHEESQTRLGEGSLFDCFGEIV